VDTGPTVQKLTPSLQELECT